MLKMEFSTGTIALEPESWPGR